MRYAISEKNGLRYAAAAEDRKRNTRHVYARRPSLFDARLLMVAILFHARRENLSQTILSNRCRDGYFFFFLPCQLSRAAHQPDRPWLATPSRRASAQRSKQVRGSARQRCRMRCPPMPIRPSTTRLTPSARALCPTRSKDAFDSIAVSALFHAFVAAPRCFCRHAQFTPRCPPPAAVQPRLSDAHHATPRQPPETIYD